MNNYGTDKPDLRISSCIRDLTSIVKNDTTSRVVQKVFDDKNKNDVRVQCVKFDAKSLREIPTSTFLSREVPEIANKWVFKFRLFNFKLDGKSILIASTLNFKVRVTVWYCSIGWKYKVSTLTCINRFKINFYKLIKFLFPIFKCRAKDNDKQKMIVSSFSMDEEGLVKSSFLKKLSPETFDNVIREIDLKKGLLFY